MSTLWKALIGMALALPMAAYVAGSFVASGADDLPRRAPVVIQDAPPKVVGEPPVLAPQPDREPDPAPPPPDTGDNEEDEADDNGIRVVRPEPTRVGDDDDDDGGDGDDSRGDDSGGGEED